MGLRELWRRHKELVVVLALASVICGFTAWYLLLDPQHIPLFFSYGNPCAKLCRGDGVAARIQATACEKNT